MYDIVYELDIPVSPEYQYAPPAYTVDNSNDTPSFSRIAYFLQLDNDYVWVSMDAFTTDRKKVGVPCHHLDCGDGSTRTVFQQLLTNVDVQSNVPGLSGSGLSGNIEFWPYGMDGKANAINIPGASDDLFDLGDKMSPKKSTRYGIMQIHINGGGSYTGTVFAFNDFNLDGSTLSSTTKHGDADVGIGNQPSGHPDWTFAANAGTYTVRKLKVYTLA